MSADLRFTALTMAMGVFRGNDRSSAFLVLTEANAIRAYVHRGDTLAARALHLGDAR